MKQIFKVENVKCGGCANTLKRELKESFGEIEVNLELHPREIALDIDNERIDELGLAVP